MGAIRAGLHHQNPAVREGCCRLLDHLVDTDSIGQLIAMADDPAAPVRTAAFHALACDPDAHVRALAAELAGKFVHTR